jgi:hypothetical protein
LELEKPSAAGAASAPTAAAAASSGGGVAAAQAAAAEQGLVVRSVKEAKKAGDAKKADVDAAVAKLLELKAAAEALENPPAAAAADAKPDDAAAPAKGTEVGVTPKSEDFGRWYLVRVGAALFAALLLCGVKTRCSLTTAGMGSV